MAPPSGLTLARESADSPTTLQSVTKTQRPLVQSPTVMPRALTLGRFKLYRHPQVIWALSAALGVGTLALAWFGGRATIEWQRTTHLFVQSRVEQVSDRVVAALRHDMTQATAVLMTRLSPRYDLTSATALGDLIGPLFPDYPYIAGFFSWNAADGTMMLIGPANRTEPRWSAVTTFEVGDGQSRVVQYQPPLFATALLARARQFDAAYPTVFGTFAFVGDGTEYQAVVRLLHPNGQRPYTGAIGFLVDVARTKADYLPETARRIAGDLGETPFTFDFFRADAPPPPPASGSFSDRTFPLRFQDASADVLEARVTFPVETWVVRTTAPDDALLAMADAGARRSFVLGGHLLRRHPDESAAQCARRSPHGGGLSRSKQSSFPMSRTRSRRR